jgi:hypothetical protein
MKIYLLELKDKIMMELTIPNKLSKMEPNYA